MNKVYKLQAQIRAKSRQELKSSRRNGNLVAILYGHNVPNQNLSIKVKDFLKIYKLAGKSSLIELSLAGQKTVLVLIHEVQYETLTQQPLHVDFYQIKKDEKIKTAIPLILSGESLAVKELGGILVKNITELEIETLPENLISELTVSLEQLKTFEDKITLKDIKLPANIVAKLPPETVIIAVNPPRSEAELLALNETVEEKIPEAAVVEKTDKEETGEKVETTEKDKPVEATNKKEKK